MKNFNRPVLALAFGLLLGCGGATSAKEPVDELLDAEIKCDWAGHKSLDATARKIFRKEYVAHAGAPGMVAAKDCLDRVGDCGAFKTCRDAAAALAGGR